MDARERENGNRKRVPRLERIRCILILRIY